MITIMQAVITTAMTIPMITVITKNLMTTVITTTDPVTDITKSRAPVLMIMNSRS